MFSEQLPNGSQSDADYPQSQPGILEKGITDEQILMRVGKSRLISTCASVVVAVVALRPPRQLVGLHPLEASCEDALPSAAVWGRMLGAPAAGI